MQLEHLHALGFQLCDEGPVVLDRAIDPQHVVEEQIVAVARRQPVVGEAGLADQDAAQLPDFG